MRILKIALLFLCSIASTLFALSESSYAKERTDFAECSTVDVRDNMNPQLKEFFNTPSNQGSLGWCYGYAASDVLSQAVGVPVSAIYTSSYYATQIGTLGRLARGILNGDGGETAGGFIGAAIDEMKDLGSACTTKGITSLGSFPYELVPHYVSLGGTGELVRLLTQIKEGAACDDLCTRRLEAHVKFYLPSFDSKEVVRFVVSNKNLSIDDILFKLFNSSCGANKIEISQNIKVHSGIEQAQERRSKDRIFEFDPTKTLLYKLDANLNNGKVVGFEYNAKYITEVGGVFGGFHASSVIGRKKINNQCYYQVRNSWGSSCHYSIGVLCSPKDGTYWVTGPTLKRMTSKLVWVD